MQIPDQLSGETGRNPVSATIAVMWRRFGPYHLARLRGAAQVLHPKCVIGIEIAGRDDYPWQTTTTVEVSRVTLFPDCCYSSLRSRAIAAAVQSVLDGMQPAAVCINGWAPPEAMAALRWCGRHRRRAILMSETFESSPNPFKAYVRRRRIRRFQGAIVGGRLQMDYLESLGFPRQRIEIGYDSVDNGHFLRATAFDGRLPEARYFLANTRFLQRKGVDALIRAYARYRAAADRRNGTGAWHLVVSGSGELEHGWKALAHHLGVAEYVHWPGFVQYDALPGIYRSAGAFVHPARREAWGLVVNEAAASGLPLIVGRRVGAACELVREGENGFLVDPDDTEAFSAVLGRVAGMTDAERGRMGHASRRLVADLTPERFGLALGGCLGRIV